MTSRLLKQLCELDIFTLMVFKNIYETGHANCTARDLAVSAPKVSRCLAALRLAFDDELFYRRQQKLKPTPLAESLYQPSVISFTQCIGWSNRFIRAVSPRTTSVSILPWRMDCFPHWR